MRIDNAIRPASVVHLSRTATGVQGAANAPARAKSVDKVELSPKVQELARLKKDLDALPEVRLDRVALAKQQMQYGAYRVDPMLVAQKMMKGQPLEGDQS